MAIGAIKGSLKGTTVPSQGTKLQEEEAQKLERFSKIEGGFMGKIGNKRRNKRNEYLQQLAEKDPGKFSREWTKVLCSPKADAARRAIQLGGQNGESNIAFDVVTEVSDRLQKIGPAAVAIEGARTKRDMTAVVAKLVAEQVHRGLYRLVAHNRNQAAKINQEPEKGGR